MFIFDITDFAFSSSKYKHISSCENTIEDCDYGCRYLNFTCGEINNENKLFISGVEWIYCVNGEWLRSRYGTIGFENCQFREFQRNYFELFKYLFTLNISNVELEILQPTTFRGTKKLTTLLASKNRLTEIPAYLFTHAENIAVVDFSNNTIQRVDSQAFDGANSLQSLNLSHNFIEKLDFNTLSVANLSIIDLSHNNLKNLSEHTFGISLKYLNLSFNPTENLNIATFAYSPNLKYLNFRHANISCIQLGIFSHLHNLISLDLAENNLKQLDFNVVLSMQSLFLEGNQLKELKGFQNAILPQLILLDINKNQFNCTYLQYFMETVNWKNIHLKIDVNSIHAGQSYIRGVDCKKNVENPNASTDEEVHRREEDSSSNSIEENTTEIEIYSFTVSSPNELTETVLKPPKADHNPSSNPYNDIVAIKIMFVFICIIMATFLVFYVVLNRKRFINQRTERSGLSEHIVKYSVVGNLNNLF